MCVARHAACLGLAALLPAVAVAEDVTAQFHLVAAPDNITGCIAADLGRLNLHNVADLAATPPSLTVADKNLGCQWTAKKQ